MPSFSWRAVTVSRAPIILGDLKDRDLVFLARVGRFRNLASGEVLIRAGEPIHSLFCIMDGSFSVSGADGQAIATLLEGEIVGEMSFFERRPPNVSVKAKVAARVMELARAPIVAKLDDDNAFAARFYRALGMSLSYRLRRASSKVEELDENLQESLIRADNHYLRLIRLLDGG
jgi:CRP/FNR family transcriptional regulator, cyclic AMP receptor protein